MEFSGEDDTVLEDGPFWMTMEGCANIMINVLEKISQLRNLAPLCASEIVLLTIIFVSMRFKTGEPASASYSRISPPTSKRNLHGSVFSGR